MPAALLGVVLGAGLGAALGCNPDPPSEVESPVAEAYLDRLEGTWIPEPSAGFETALSVRFDRDTLTLVQGDALDGPVDYIIVDTDRDAVLIEVQHPRRSPLPMADIRRRRPAADRLVHRHLVSQITRRRSQMSAVWKGCLLAAAVSVSACGRDAPQFESGAWDRGGGERVR